MQIIHVMRARELKCRRTSNPNKSNENDTKLKRSKRKKKLEKKERSEKQHIETTTKRWKEAGEIIKTDAVAYSFAERCVRCLIRITME